MVIPYHKAITLSSCMCEESLRTRQYASPEPPKRWNRFLFSPSFPFAVLLRHWMHGSNTGKSCCIPFLGLGADTGFAESYRLGLETTHPSGRSKGLFGTVFVPRKEIVGLALFDWTVYLVGKFDPKDVPGTDR